MTSVALAPRVIFFKKMENLNRRDTCSYPKARHLYSVSLYSKNSSKDGQMDKHTDNDINHFPKAYRKEKSEWTSEVICQFVVLLVYSYNLIILVE
jgi:hypothetical protein